MAAKRKRSLRGSPAEHRNRARLDYEGAAGLFSDAEAALRTGSCHKAFDDYSLGLEDFGSYVGNYTDAGMFESAENAVQLRSLNKMRSKVRKSFFDKCLTMPSMNGLGRRPSRRRRYEVG
jgi:hypothetical protein